MTESEYQQETQRVQALQAAQPELLKQLRQTRLSPAELEASREINFAQVTELKGLMRK